MKLGILFVLLAAACLGAPRKSAGPPPGIGRGFHGPFVGAGVHFRIGARTGISGFGFHIVSGAPVRRPPRRYYPFVVPPPVFLTAPPAVTVIRPR
jgi:hypothetical protein